MFDAFFIFLKQNMSKEIATFVIAMLPVFELRGAIPFGLSMNLPIAKVLLLSSRESCCCCADTIFT